jgi:TRAP-type C4-dicarboxylate transport system permease large subunit
LTAIFSLSATAEAEAEVEAEVKVEVETGAEIEASRAIAEGSGALARVIPPATAEAGPATAEGEESTVNKALEEVPKPGCTEMVAVMAVAIRLAGTVVVSCVALL